MAQILDMPPLSDTMKIGVLQKWRKNEGDSMVPGEVLAEVHDRLVGLDLGEHVARLDRVARLLEPLEDLALFHRVGELRHEDVGRHRVS
jgi:hypothetical protein